MLNVLFTHSKEVEKQVSPKDFAGWQDRLLAFTREVPTLVLWGDQDPFMASTYAERFGAACIEHFAENGHWLAIEAPDEVAHCLQTFLAAEIPAA